jgi:DNA-binding beta-propeller fold protein YncE
VSLKALHFIPLPEHVKPGGFDHAAIHRRSGRLYVAHTSNDALEVIDCAADQYLHSIHGLTGVAGALVSDELELVFSSNRGENTIGIFPPGDEKGLVKIPVGVRPNGLAFDPKRGLLLAANVGNPEIPGSFTLSIVDIQRKEMIHSIPVPGRTRWTVFDPQGDVFYVNIAEPAQILVVDADKPGSVAGNWAIPAAGPHGLDLDRSHQRLFCACDAARLVIVDTHQGKVTDQIDLMGTPDVIFYNAALQHLYVAIGDPGVIEVFDTRRLNRLEIVPTEKGAHTIAYDAQRNKIYAFLPQTNRAAVYVDG